MKRIFTLLSITLLSITCSSCGEKLQGEIPISLEFIEGTWRIDAEREIQAIKDLGNELTEENERQISSGWVRFSRGVMTLGGLNPEDEKSAEMERIEEAGDYVRFYVEQPSTREKEGIKIVAIDSDTIRILLDHQKGEAQQFLRSK